MISHVFIFALLKLGYQGGSGQTTAFVHTLRWFHAMALTVIARRMARAMTNATRMNKLPIYE
jgi:hypothetical protein